MSEEKGKGPAEKDASVEPDRKTGAESDLDKSIEELRAHLDSTDATKRNEVLKRLSESPVGESAMGDFRPSMERRSMFVMDKNPNQAKDPFAKAHDSARNPEQEQVQKPEKEREPNDRS